EPYFVDSEAGNLRLQPYSLCINKGSASASTFSILDYDIDGNERIFNGKTDIGAFEFKGDHLYVETPVLSDNDTFHTQNFLLELYSSTPNNSIYYTLDGTEPGVNSTRYNIGSPVNISSNTVIKAKAFKDGYTPSLTYEKKYYFGRELKGNISGTLSYKDYPYYVTDNINVLTGASLNIGQGADIRFLNPYQLKVTGRLVAEGTYDEPINFSPADTTGFYLDKYYNGGWKGIYFLNSYAEQNILKFTNLKFAKKIFTSNAAEYVGGAIHNYESKLLIENCRFGNNKAFNGGAVYSSDNAISNYINNIFINNRAVNGGVLFTTSSSDVFVNNTVVMNTAMQGGGFYFGYLSGVNSYLFNNIIYGNSANTGNQIYSDNSSALMEFNNIQGGKGEFGGTYTGIYAENNLPSLYPGFDLDNETDPYSLLNYSPLLNAGKPDLSGYNMPVTDIIGNPRIYAGSEVRIDIGAYEYQGEPCGDPIIEFKPSGKIDFGYVQDGKPDSLTLYINNIGTRPLNITDITFYESNSVFRAELFGATKESFIDSIGAHATDSLRIIFTPNAGIDNKYTDIMKISSAELTSVLVVNFSGFGVAGTYIDNGGLVSGEWRKENNPYNVVRDIEVYGDLTIYEGVKVRFYGNTNLRVAENDKLIVNGTYLEKVYFTAADTTGFDIMPDDLNGGWRGI
ncbi:MAG: chitobiase/beta-hexosaminidase C-terminal domain-containing protein, partial [Candidatus Delongbacteria bacterium]|nr:chitobiase/beta-hexosaminidase C-terminal domain-containing protein [Candidatus Delongbacteria bacterium]